MEREPIMDCGPPPLKIVCAKVEPKLSPHLIGLKVSVYEPVHARTKYGFMLCRTKAEWVKLYPYEEPDPKFVCAEEPWKDAILLGISRKDNGGDIFFETRTIKNNMSRFVEEHKWTEVRISPHDQSCPISSVVKVKMDDRLQVYSLANPEPRPVLKPCGSHTVASFMRYPFSLKSLPTKPVSRTRAVAPFSIVEQTRISMLSRGETCDLVSSKKD
jgi:hypothetical protein